MPGKKHGRISLVGAGPGDPELLTLKAVRTMQDADIILFDSLVSEEILSFAKKKTRRMLVGKRGHRPSCRQEDINVLMVKLARQGKHVVRLKSGDPVMFGRAGEEIEVLKREGFEVAVIPGVTSASAMAALLGTSLTHRDHAHSVRFVTGHSRDGTLPKDLDWKGLADPATTLVIYMGGRTGAHFAKQLIEHGLAPRTPSVVAISVSRPNERRLVGTIEMLASGELKCETPNPVLIGVGNVFGKACAGSLLGSTGIDDVIEYKMGNSL